MGSLKYLVRVAVAAELTCSINLHVEELRHLPSRRGVTTTAAARDGDEADTEDEEREPGAGGATRGGDPRASRAVDRSTSPEARVPVKRRRMSASFHPRGVRATV